MSPPPGLWAFFVLIAGVAAWIDFGSIHSHLRDDTLIFPLASVYAYAPFFWEQDRIGMLVPLVCMPVTDPWANLLAEVFLTAFMGLSVPVLAAEYARPGPNARWAGVIAVAVALAFGPPIILNNTLHECCYPSALFLGLVGLVVLDRGGSRPRWWRYGVAFVGLALAHWVYLGALLGLGGLIVWRSWIGGPGGVIRRPLLPLRDSHPRAALLLLLAGFAAGLAMMFLAAPGGPDYQPLPQGSTPVEEWPEVAGEVLWRLYDPDRFAGQPWLFALATVGLAGLIAAICRRGTRPALAGSAVLLLAGATELAAVCTRDWPTKNEYHTRYVLAGALYLGPAAALPLVAAVRGALGRRGRWVAAAVGVIGVFAAAWWQYGWPSPGTARASLDEGVGRYSDEILASGAHAVGGQYWQVWSSVYHANLVRRERGGGKPVVGVAYRSWVWKPIWEANYPDGMTVAVFRGPNNYWRFEHSCKLFGLTAPVRVGATANFDLYTVRPDPHRPPAELP